MSEIKIELTEEETKVLIKVLENYIPDLSSEIADTDKKEYRENLKSEKIILNRILSKLQNKN